MNTRTRTHRRHPPTPEKTGLVPMLQFLLLTNPDELGALSVESKAKAAASCMAALSRRREPAAKPQGHTASPAQPAEQTAGLTPAMIAKLQKELQLL